MFSVERQDSGGQSMAMGQRGRPKAVSALRWEEGIWMGVAGRAVDFPGTKKRIPSELRSLPSSLPAEAGFLSAMLNMAPESNFSMWVRISASW